jgi:hypothetical protein
MKKLYTLLFVTLSSFVFSQSVVITRVVDGTLGSGGCTSTTTGTSSPKIVEMYVSGTVNFTNYRFQTESNGAVDAAAISWSGNLDLTPLGSKTNEFVYLVVSPTTTFNEMYPSIVLPTGLTAGNIPNGNGNDAYRIAIYDAPTAGNLVSVVDQFGNPLDLPANDYSAAWCYQDSYANRNNGVPANGGTFVTNSFTYGGNAAFVAPNNTCAFISTAINLGSFTLSNESFNLIEGLKMYPNPAKNILYIETALNSNIDVTIVDVLGKEVLNTKAVNNSVDVTSLQSGIYIVKIAEEGKNATRKLVIE